MSTPHGPYWQPPWQGIGSPPQSGYGQWGGPPPYQAPGYAYPPPGQGYPPPGYPPPSNGRTPFGDTDCVGARVLQYLVDFGLFISVPYLIMIVVIAVVANTTGDVSPLLGLFALVVWLGLLVFQLWNYIFRPVRSNGQTLGMQWLGLRIVRADGTPLTAGRTFVRWLLLFLDAGVLYGVLGLVLMLATDFHQRLGDLAAKTLVVRVR